MTILPVPTVAGPGGGVFEQAPPPEARPAALEEGPYCFGAEVALCERLRSLPLLGGAAGPACIVVANGACLVLGVVLITATLAVALNALLEG